MSATGSGAVCFADLSGFCLTFLKRRSKWKGTGQSLNTWSKQRVWEKSLHLMSSDFPGAFFVVILIILYFWSFFCLVRYEGSCRPLDVMWSPVCWTCRLELQILCGHRLSNAAAGQRGGIIHNDTERAFSHVSHMPLLFFLIFSSGDLIKWIVLNIGVKRVQLGHWN